MVLVGVFNLGTIFNLLTANVIPVKITDNPRTDPCTMYVKCKYYRDYLYHDMPVIVI